MKPSRLILLVVAISLVLIVPVFAEDDNSGSYAKPYKKDAYGPGVNSDATGRAFRWKTEDGQTVTPGTKVVPDAYGPGVGSDAYGRPVRPESE